MSPRSFLHGPQIFPPPFFSPTPVFLCGCHPRPHRASTPLGISICVSPHPWSTMNSAQLTSTIPSGPHFGFFSDLSPARRNSGAMLGSGMRLSRFRLGTRMREWIKFFFFFRGLFVFGFAFLRLCQCTDVTATWAELAVSPPPSIDTPGRTQSVTEQFAQCARRFIGLKHSALKFLMVLAVPPLSPHQFVTPPQRSCAGLIHPRYPSPILVRYH